MWYPIWNWPSRVEGRSLDPNAGMDRPARFLSGGLDSRLRYLLTVKSPSEMGLQCVLARARGVVEFLEAKVFWDRDVDFRDVDRPLHGKTETAFAPVGRHAGAKEPISRPGE